MAFKITQGEKTKDISKLLTIAKKLGKMYIHIYTLHGTWLCKNLLPIDKSKNSIQSWIKTCSRPDTCCADPWWLC